MVVKVVENDLILSSGWKRIFPLVIVKTKIIYMQILFNTSINYILAYVDAKYTKNILKMVQGCLQVIISLSLHIGKL